MLKPENLDQARLHAASTRTAEPLTPQALIKEGYTRDQTLKDLKDALKRQDQTSQIAKEWHISLAKCSVDSQD